MSSFEAPSPALLRSSVEGSVVIVTGAASGIGFSIAQTMADAGAQVVLSDRDERAGREATAKISKGAAFVQCDVASWDDQLRLFAFVEDRFGRVDIVVCNAGIDPEILCSGPAHEDRVTQARKKVACNFLAEEIDESDGRLKAPPNSILDVNVIGVIYGVKLASYWMSRCGGGRIIIIGSAASYIPTAEQTIYCASKHAALGLMRASSQRADVLAKKIAISMVAPWLTTTAMTRDLDTNLTAGVVASTPKDVAMAVAVLASQPLAIANGRSIWVQGQSMIDVEEVMTKLSSSLM